MSQSPISAAADADRPVLVIVIASTRPGRVGLPVGTWFDSVARAHGGFEIQLVDLAVLNLPFMDEPNHPQLRQYLHDHTRNWSAIIDRADAVVFVTPEYNYSMTAPLKNAIDFLCQEWARKPVGFVSYGGISGGMRAVQMAKQVVTTLSMMAIFETVTIPFVAKMISDEGEFRPTEEIERGATTMLDGLARWAPVLKTLRADA